jgi:hypothetical protein
VREQTMRPVRMGRGWGLIDLRVGIAVDCAAKVREVPEPSR